MSRSTTKRRACAICALVLAASSPTASSAQPAPLKASAPAGAVGDGRTLVPVEIVGGSGPDEFELRNSPMRPYLQCANATVLPSLDGRSPAVLVPAVRKAKTIKCIAHHREDAAPISLSIAAPPPGLYAEVSSWQPQVSDRALLVSPFSVDASGVAQGVVRPRASASSGTLTAGAGGALTLNLPESKAPRALAIVLSDGQRAGAVFVPLAGKTALPVKSKPRNQVSIRIAGSWFGPVQATKGETTIGIVVPPGIEFGVVRAVDKRANAKEKAAALNTPKLPRIAAIAAADVVGAGQQLVIHVAVASALGGPAEPNLPIVASATRGKLGAVRSLGKGLWEVKYTADSVLGDSEIRVSISGDASAGEVPIVVKTVPGPAATIALALPEGRHEAGQELIGILKARDAFGNLLVDGEGIELSLAGEPIALAGADEGWTFRAPIPKVLPAERQMPLVATTGSVTETLAVTTHAGVAVSAEMRFAPEGRETRIVAIVRDEHGNLADPADFELVAEDGSLKRLIKEDAGLSTRIRADERARSARVSIVVGGRELAKRSLDFDPPQSAILVGSYASGSYTSNLGDLNVPRAGVGLGLRRGLGPIESALLVGIEGFSMSDEVVTDAGGMATRVNRQLRGLALPVMLRARLPISYSLGISVSGGVVPVAASASLSTTSAPDRRGSWVVGARAGASADYRLGPGRVTAGLTFGRARLKEGPIVGDIDGFGFLVGFEWWPLDVNE